MKKKTLTAIYLLAFISPLFSQTGLPTIQDNKSKYLGTPLITIRGEEISRFPTNNFLDAVNGLYPWLFSPDTDPGKYLYVVNGNILLDVNAISLHDIEEVSFTRSNADGTLYPFSQIGIFYIKTKHTDSRKPVISFNTQYNTVWNKNKQVFYTAPEATKQDNSSGYLQTNQASISTGTEKLQFYASALINTLKDPGLSQSADYGSGNFTNAALKLRHLNIGTFAQLSYQFSPNISAGISANYYHGQTKRGYEASSNSFGSLSHYTQEGKSRISYYHIAPYFNWAINSKLRNTLNFEYAGDRLKADNNFVSTFSATSSPAITQEADQTTNPYLRGYIVRDHLEYDLITTAKFKTSIGAVLSYQNRELRDKREYMVTQTGVPVSAGYSFFYYREKITTLNPLLHFSYDNIFTGYAGHSFLLSKQEFPFIPFTSRSKRSYYGGMGFDIKSLMKKNADLERLDLSVHYSNLTKNISDNYWLPSIEDPAFSPSTNFDGTPVSSSPDPLKLDVLRNQLLSVQFNSSFMKGRVQIGAEWSQLKQDVLYRVEAPMGFTYAKGKMTQKGIAVYSSVKLIDRDKQQWKMRLNILLPDRDHDLNGGNYLDLIETNYKMQAGLQNYFRFGGLYAQVNGLIGLNRKTYDYSTIDPGSGKSSTDIILNYMLIGYDFSVSSKSAFSKLSVFLHARNLAGTETTRDYYAYSSYAGAGIQFQMK